MGLIPQFPIVPLLWMDSVHAENDHAIVSLDPMVHSIILGGRLVGLG